MFNNITNTITRATTNKIRLNVFMIKDNRYWFKLNIKKAIHNIANGFEYIIQGVLER